MSGASIVPFQGTGSSIRNKRNTTSAIDNENDVTTPLDLSFCRYTDIKEAIGEEPRASPRKSKNQKPGSKEPPIKCCRMNNNNLQNIKSIKDTLENFELDPQSVEWIDLSYNELTTIEVLEELENLKILYLHGNHITDLKQIRHLKGLKKLKKLTLHGNEVAEQKDYKNYVLTELPQLVCLDFALVTKSEHKTAAAWNKSENQQKKKVKKDDD